MPIEPIVFRKRIDKATPLLPAANASYGVPRVVMNLRQLGMTAAGASAAANGRAVYGPGDRQLLADLVVSVVQCTHGVPAGNPDRPVISGSVPNLKSQAPATGKRFWRVTNLTKGLQQSGFSPLGARQVLAAEVVTHPADLKLIASIMQTDIRKEMLNNKYSENMRHK